MTTKIVLVAICLNMGLLSFLIYLQYLIFMKVYGPKKVKEKNKRAAFVPEADAEYVPEPPKKRYRARDYPQRPQR